MNDRIDFDEWERNNDGMDSEDRKPDFYEQLKTWVHLSFQNRLQYSVCMLYLHQNKTTLVVSMNFVWDENKAEINLRKHGVSFLEASTVFEDYDALQIYDPDHSEEEDRFIMLGMSSALRILLVCHCYRENDEQIRIISARKATKKETDTYNGRK